uniref:ATP-dependent helicase/nuclease subunit A n=1 Tax=Lygus hesperus TaxID=30085 RepID=A0A0A9YY89_LYGHE
MDIVSSLVQAQDIMATAEEHIIHAIEVAEEVSGGEVSNFSDLKGWIRIFSALIFGLVEEFINEIWGDEEPVQEAAVDVKVGDAPVDAQEDEYPQVPIDEEPEYSDELITSAINNLIEYGASIVDSLNWIAEWPHNLLNSQPNSGK